MPITVRICFLFTALLWWWAGQELKDWVNLIDMGLHIPTRFDSTPTLLRLRSQNYPPMLTFLAQVHTVRLYYGTCTYLRCLINPFRERLVVDYAASLFASYFCNPCDQPWPHLAFSSPVLNSEYWLGNSPKGDVCWKATVVCPNPHSKDWTWRSVKLIRTYQLHNACICYLPDCRCL